MVVKGSRYIERSSYLINRLIFPVKSDINISWVSIPVRKSHKTVGTKPDLNVTKNHYCQGHILHSVCENETEIK